MSESIANLGTVDLIAIGVTVVVAIVIVAVYFSHKKVAPKPERMIQNEALKLPPPPPPMPQVPEKATTSVPKKKSAKKKTATVDESKKSR